ncbi:hypothetical protein M1M25_gp042 [Tenacibaculum phage Gundel_1]|uniref:Uncharacterized protein n=1 Tax=Tenacibaculum phage Gundel_1 TaxID=2745672 RepID=A0A8E4ZMV2_9CAUD|nr:hypothetical protein M1M25_gp042 [Tenacibaculum phage Gundel_1]QQV91475.1 hypothetical protein Gundel1_42 [Tenacibaculum phage Gundel_1]
MEIKFERIQENLQENLEDYKLKTNEQLINYIIEFGCGETGFHTGDIERLIKENQWLKKKQEEIKCSSCGKGTPELCGSCVSDIAQETGEQAINSII